MISVKEITSYLQDYNMSNKIIAFSSLDSTNEHAKKLARAKAEHGTVIISNSQTAGKGRHGRSFYSPADNGIYMSLILCPNRIGFSQALITPFAAVAICNAIESVSSVKPRVKWVNDIFMNGRKVCGILTESVADTHNAASFAIVLGIGINHCVPETGFPKDIIHVAGAVFANPNPLVTREQLASEVIKRVLFARPEPQDEEILREYKQRMLMLGEKISVKEPNQSYNAIALDIDGLGRLIVLNDAGETICLSSGEISVRS